MISQRARQRTKDEIVQLAAKAEKQTARVEELEAEVRKLKEQVQTVTADNTRLSQLCSRFVSSALAGQAAAAGGAGAPAAAQAAAVPAAANNYIPPHLLANAAFGGYGAGGFGAGALGGAYSPHDPYAAAAAYAGFPSAAYPGLGGLVPQPPMHMMAAPPGVSSSHAAAMALGAESERARLRAAGVNVDQGRRLSAAGSITGGAAPAGNSDAENQLLIQSLLGRRS